MKTILFFLVGVGIHLGWLSTAGADSVYRTYANGNIGDYQGSPHPSFASHDESWSDVTNTHSVASAVSNVLSAFTSSSGGNGAVPFFMTTGAEFQDEIVIDWAGAATVTLALNVHMSGSLDYTNYAYSELRLFSYLGGTTSGMFTGGGPNLTSRYGRDFTGGSCDGLGGFCDAFTGSPTNFDTSAELGFITVATNTPLPFFFQLQAYTSIGASGGNYGSAVSDLSAGLPSFSDIFTVSSSGFDGNIYSTSGLINNNRWAASVPEPSPIWLLFAIGFGLSAIIRVRNNEILRP